MLKDARHATLGQLFFTHLGEFALRDRRLRVYLLEFLVCEEALRHDPRDLLEVVEDGLTSVLLAAVGRAKLAKVVVGVEGHRGARLTTQTVLSFTPSPSRSTYNGS